MFKRKKIHQDKFPIWLFLNIVEKYLETIYIEIMRLGFQI